MSDIARKGYVDPSKKAELEKTILRLGDPKALIRGAVRDARKNASDRLGKKDK